MRRIGEAFATLGLGMALLTHLGGCTVGQGEGWARSASLEVPECRSGAFDLQPDFFSANPYRQQSILLRIQHGDDIKELSDGLIVHIPDLRAVRQHLGEDLPVGLPAGVSNPRLPPGTQGTSPISLGLYLNRSCRKRNVALYSLAGTMRFSALFSGDPNEESGAERLSEAYFKARFGDPRAPTQDSELDPVPSEIEGYFKFYFQRGQPAQPFP